MLYKINTVHKCSASVSQPRLMVTQRQWSRCTHGTDEGGHWCAVRNLVFSRWKFGGLQCMTHWPQKATLHNVTDMDDNNEVRQHFWASNVIYGIEGTTRHVIALSGQLGGSQSQKKDCDEKLNCFIGFSWQNSQTNLAMILIPPSWKFSGTFLVRTCLHFYNEC